MIYCYTYSINTTQTSVPAHKEAVSFHRLDHLHQVEAVQELLDGGDPKLLVRAGSEIGEDHHVCGELLVPDRRQGCMNLCFRFKKGTKG